MSIRAVFIDVDGTTVFSEPRNRRAIEDVSRIGGYEIKPEDWEFLGGNADGIIWEKVAEVEPRIKDVFNTAASFELGCLHAKLLRINEVQPIPETAEAITLFRESDTVDIIAPVSNSITPDAGASLRHAGLDPDSFSFCLFRDELQRRGLRAKPHPDPYNEALREANARRLAGTPEIAAQECLVLEDSKTGVRGGLSAGQHTIHIVDDDTPLPDDEAHHLMHKHGGRYYKTTRAGLVTLCKQILTP